jgi:hypothetical protein
MRAPFILFMAFFLSLQCNAQSDLLILRKHSKTVKSFFPGTEMNFYIGNHYHTGSVTSIQRDSIYLIYYDVRHLMTNLGFFMLDTVATYPFSVDYREITSFNKERKNFNWSGSGAALMGGGVLLATAGLVTWILTKPNTQYHASPQFVIAAAAIGAAGYLIMKSGSKNIKLGKKYTLRYIKLK